VKRGLAVIALGLIALGIQGGLAAVLPRELCPDLGLLVVVVLGLHAQNWASGFVLASALGYAADLLSGSLFGAHALLRILAFCAASLVRSQLNLRGSLPLAFFVGCLTILYALALIGLTSFFGAAAELHWGTLKLLIPQAIVNAVVAPSIARLMLWVWERLEGEPARRRLELDARRTAT